MSIDLCAVRTQIKDAANAVNYMVQVARIRKVDRYRDLVRGSCKADAKIARDSIQANCSLIRLICDVFDARNAAVFQERHQGLPIERGPIGKCHLYRRLPLYSAPAAFLTELLGRTIVNLAEHGIEATHAPEAGRITDLRQRHFRFIDKLLRKMQASRLGDFNRRGTEMVLKKTVELTRINIDLVGQFFYRTIIQKTLVD